MVYKLILVFCSSLILAEQLRSKLNNIKLDEMMIYNNMIFIERNV